MSQLHTTFGGPVPTEVNDADIYAECVKESNPQSDGFRFYFQQNTVWNFTFEQQTLFLQIQLNCPGNLGTMRGPGLYSIGRVITLKTDSVQPTDICVRVLQNGNSRDYLLNWMNHTMQGIQDLSPVDHRLSILQNEFKLFSANPANFQDPGRWQKALQDFWTRMNDTVSAPLPNQLGGDTPFALTQPQATQGTKFLLFLCLLIVYLLGKVRVSNPIYSATRTLSAYCISPD
jgi:hypothetical protein